MKSGIFYTILLELVALENPTGILIVCVTFKIGPLQFFGNFITSIGAFVYSIT
jgi:hypothetical protein